MCVRERGGERERKGEGERVQLYVCVCACVGCVVNGGRCNIHANVYPNILAFVTATYGKLTKQSSQEKEVQSKMKD